MSSVNRCRHSQFDVNLNTQNQNRQRWRCAKCSKVLSSKRSYDEHMNVHNDKRPFACDQCKYAAASQMTLRRHKLRNHIPRNLWGYQCPHCSEFYMEPASYQQHVSTRHVGSSATFGCTFCHFTTKSSKHFREHIFKHLHVVARRSGTDEIDSCSINVSEFLIDDENGQGHYTATKQLQSDHNVGLTSSVLRSNTAFLECGPDFFKTPLESKNSAELVDDDVNIRMNQRQATTSKTLNKVTMNDRRQNSNYILIKNSDDFLKEYVVLDVPEIQNEVIIDESETYKVSQRKTEVDDFGLD